jgi:hypothetical protein
VVTATGGGSGAIAALLSVPGASRTVLEATIPYASAALAELLGARPEHFCSARTARAMAMKSWLRARELAAAEGRDEPCSGAGCAAALATDRPKRGDHRAYVAVQDEDRTVTLSVIFEKHLRSRAEEEALLTRLILAELGRRAGLEPLVAPLATGDRFEREEVVAEPAWRELLTGRQNHVTVGNEPGNAPTALFPGAFNPLHAGHRQMAALAAELLRRPVAFELSLFNVDKPPLDYAEIAARVRQFSQQDQLLLTRAPTFVEKARLFPGATFVVGADTIVRIADSHYYDSPAVRDAALAELAAAGCRFLVFGRAREGRFESLARLPLPPALREICDEVPEACFRMDLSSTELRNR